MHVVATAGHVDHGKSTLVRALTGMEPDRWAMLAGVGPVPAVLLVVAADGGWMPQSAEHLAAVDALGVRHGLVAVTRCDLAGPGPATASKKALIFVLSVVHSHH